MRLALAQILSTTDPTHNLALVEAESRAAAEAGAQLVVFPEATMCRFGAPLARIAEPLDGQWADGIRNIAHTYGITVVAGMFTPADSGRVYNTLLVTGPGQEASYNKIHLYDAFGFAESDTVAPGTDPITVEINGTTVGLATCYDIRFPALFQELATRGADLIVLTASWGAGPGKREQWELLVKARALDAGTFVAACDQADPTSIGEAVDSAPTGVGSSLVAGPFGQVLGRLGPGPGLLVTDIDATEARNARAATGVLANRRQLPSTERLTEKIR